MAAPIDAQHSSLALFQKLKGRKEEGLTAQLYNLVFDKTKLEKGRHSFSEEELQKKLEEIQTRIDKLAQKLSSSQIEFVQDQIAALDDEEFED